MPPPPPSKSHYDAIIIGAGPVGLFAVFELGLNDVGCLLIDTLDKVGGQCAELYPEKPIYDIPAFPVITGQELTDALMEQIKPFNPEFLLGTTVIEYTKSTDEEGALLYQVRTDEGGVYTAKVLVVASGGGNFTPKRLPIADAAGYEGRRLWYAVRQRKQFAKQHLVVCGGGDSAVDWALALYEDAASLTVVHRRPEFRAAPDSVRKLHLAIEAGSIGLVIGAPHAMGERDSQSDGTANKAEGAANKAEGPAPLLLDVKTDPTTIETLTCDHVLAFYGLTMKPGPVADFGLAMHDGLIVVDTEKFETSVPGVFAIGDINHYPGKLKLILSGFHEAALMAQQVFRYVYPDRRLRFQYTTSSSQLQRKLGVGKATG
ncbi:MAG: NAD(P)/FAD-dependent oxidoreductase [Alphaproteobacteria bacterium]|nr:NAD(P)/FAD-dependent oxidoreductase [Alphaproteobacteria bacterium]